MKKQVYLLEAVSNLHVGNLGDSMAIVDKSVQRDALTGFPTIHATSLKGALRNAAEAEKERLMRSEGGADALIRYVFGGDVSDGSQGNYRFLSAHLLFYPVRGASCPYYLATCPSMLMDACRQLSLAERTDMVNALQALCGALGKNENGCVLEAGASDGEKVRVEHLLLPKREGGQALEDCLRWLPGEEALVLLSDQEMQKLLKELPVIARNQLNNGISANLWYEEFVPRKSFFLTLLLTHEEKKAFTEFLTEQCHQIGANATVGYGLCCFWKL